MMDTFTSIFHEEVIAIDEVKGEAEDYYEGRHATTRKVGSVNSNKRRDEFHKGYEDAIKNKSSEVYRPMRTAQDYHDRVKDAEKSKQIEKDINKAADQAHVGNRNAMRAYNRAYAAGVDQQRRDQKKSVKESFLDFDII